MTTMLAAAIQTSVISDEFHGNPSPKKNSTRNPCTINRIGNQEYIQSP
ncbi:hypothetical protein [Terribacillus saccharophilus]|nr:hypothetical protein [Terribacillus saccharophilus]